jgi:addiction module RelE/StbE family toxin
MPEHKYCLRVAPKAAEDLDAIYGYIFNTLSATVAANDLFEHIEKATMRLTVFPFSGSYVLEEPLRAKGYRKVVVDNYLIFYLVDETQKQVVIMRVLFGASKYLDIL